MRSKDQGAYDELASRPLGELQKASSRSEVDDRFIGRRVQYICACGTTEATNPDKRFAKEYFVGSHGLDRAIGLIALARHVGGVKFMELIHRHELVQACSELRNTRLWSRKHPAYANDDEAEQ